jgi:nitrile hydratase subunit alpha
MIRRSGNRFADKIMRQINSLARDPTQNRFPLFPIARYGVDTGRWMRQQYDMSDHEHDHGHSSELSEMQLRVRALETILVEKGYVDPATLDAIIETYEHKIGPHNGARAIARAWVDPDFRRQLFADAAEAFAALGVPGGAAHLIALENTPQQHNMVVCTLCSCYPSATLGLPPVWYKSSAYRSRTVADPRGVLRDFGVELPADMKIRVWDSTAEVRYMVVPMRPKGTESWSEERLASIINRDCMIGTRLPDAGDAQ